MILIMTEFAVRNIVSWQNSEGPWLGSCGFYVYTPSQSLTSKNSNELSYSMRKAADNLYYAINARKKFELKGLELP